MGKVFVSRCCKAPVNVGGGGYDGEDVCALTDTCSECGQLLATNGSQYWVELRHPISGRILKRECSNGKTIIEKEVAGKTDERIDLNAIPF